MKLTIIPSDRAVIVDGDGLLNIEQDWSWISEEIHAVQWYDDHGHIEFVDTRPNQNIEELGIYSQALTILEDEKNRLEQVRLDEEAAREAARDYWQELRQIRNYTLLQSDWTQLPDAPITEAKKQEWSYYRQQLRDLPNNITDPKPLVWDINHPDWPTKPS